jgi:selenoprotein W-related protein
LNADVKLIAGSGGVFDVAVDGKVVIKKTWEGFPDEESIVKAVSEAL